jgi:hypothetical protein
MRSVGFALAVLLPIFVIAGCSSDTTPRDVSVRLFVDTNSSQAWDEGDVPLPNMVVFLDKDLSAITDSEGHIIFEDISGKRHTITLDEEAVADLTAHSIVCQESSQTITLDGDTEVLFCFAAQGFMEVDVSEEGEGN